MVGHAFYQQDYLGRIGTTGTDMLTSYVYSLRTSISGTRPNLGLVQVARKGPSESRSKNLSPNSHCSRHARKRLSLLQPVCRMEAAHLTND